MVQIIVVTIVGLLWTKLETYSKMLKLWIKILNIFNVSIIINHSHKWQIVSLANSVIIVIMSWSYLDSTLNKTNKEFNRGRISSVGRALGYRAGGRGFDSRGRTNTQGLKISEKWRYCLYTASSETFARLRRPRKMAVPSPAGNVKLVSLISTFVLNTLTLK